MLKCTRNVALITLVMSLTGCAGLSEIPFTKLSNLSNASFNHIGDPIAQGTPIALYGHIARNIKRCWLSQPEPKLKNYGFYAKAAPGDAGGQASISLNEMKKGGGRGLTAFKIDFLPLEGKKTNIRINNFRFPEKLAEELQTTVRYWSTGQTNCELPAPKNNIVSIPPGVKIKPIKTQTQ